MAEVQGTIGKLTVGSGDKTREIDLTKLRPITLGDRKRLLSELGLDLRKAVDFTPEQDVALVMFILRKIDPTVTAEEVEDLPTVVGQSIVSYSAALSQATDRPFLPQSTS